MLYNENNWEKTRTYPEIGHPAHFRSVRAFVGPHTNPTKAALKRPKPFFGRWRAMLGLPRAYPEIEFPDEL